MVAEQSLFTLIAFIFILKCSECKPNNSTCKQVTGYDYVQLVVQWGPGVCFANKRCRRYDQNWTIHGTWPQSRKRSDAVQFCCSEPFNRSALMSISDELNIHWKSLHCDACNSIKFWKHEWRKHGSCAAFTRKLRGTVNYFNQTLQLFKSLKLNDLFANTSIIAGNLNNSVYDLQTMRTLVKAKIATEVTFVCRTAKHVSNTPVLTEIIVCYHSETLQAIDCPKRDRCRSKSVLFLAKS